MASHSDLIRTDQIERVAAETGASVHTVRSWRQRGSIPAQYWTDLARMGIATVEQLAVGAPSRRSKAA